MFSCAVNNLSVPAEYLSVRAMNFGQPVAVRAPLSYRLSFAPHHIVKAMASYYRDFVIDDHQHASADSHSTTLALRRLGWPPLPHLVTQSPGLFVAFLQDHAGYDTLTTMLASATQARYILNTIDTITLAHDQVVIAGVCYGAH